MHTSTSTTTYLVDPELVIRLGLSDSNRIEVCVGTGSTRKEVYINNPTVIEFLLEVQDARSEQDYVHTLSKKLRIDPLQAQELFKLFVENQIVKQFDPGGSATPLAADIRWDDWGWRDALDYHTATSNMVWVHDYESKKEKPQIMTYLRNRTPILPDRPKPAQKAPHPTWSIIKLPPPTDKIKSVQYKEALYNRRTFREFSSTSVSLADFSDFLYFGTQPILLEGSRPFRPTPTYSLGHFFSLYVVVNNVEGMDPGVYLYLEDTHSVALIKKGAFSNLLASLAQNQSFMDNASFGMFISVHWDQYMWKYRFSRSYRLALYEISSTVQTLLILLSGLGLKSFLTPAITDRAVAQLLEIEDLEQECPIYILGAGNS